MLWNMLKLWGSSHGLYSCATPCPWRGQFTPRRWDSCPLDRCVWRRHSDYGKDYLHTYIYTIVRPHYGQGVVAVLYIYREPVLQHLGIFTCSNPLPWEHCRSFAGPRTSRDGDFIIRGFKASKVWGYHWETMVGWWLRGPPRIYIYIIYIIYNIYIYLLRITIIHDGRSYYIRDPITVTNQYKGMTQGFPIIYIYICINIHKHSYIRNI